VKKAWALILVLCLLLTQWVWAGAQENAVTVIEIQKHGNLVLSVSGPEFFEMGFACGDVVTVGIGESTFDMPVGTNYSDVDNGELVCRVTDSRVILAINMGDLATAAGIAVKTKIEAEPGYRWDYSIPQPVEVTFTLKEAGGYYDEYVMHQLTRTNERGDYAGLSDEAFANFRKVTTTGMGKLYRSSSPVNPELNRSAYGDAAMKAAGVKTVINLADTNQGMKAYAGYADTYYQGCSIIGLNLGVDFMAEDFKAGFAQGLRFILQNEGPYLIHCNEGKDRAGFTAAVLECLMGASADEVIADYMTTYENYYGVAKGSDQYAAIARSNIEKSLSAAFEVEDIRGVALAEEAEVYLTQQLGLTPEEVVDLKAKLAD